MIAIATTVASIADNTIKYGNRISENFTFIFSTIQANLYLSRFPTPKTQ